jgi:hypothetical protein
MPFYTSECRHFTKTGSGQTQGKKAALQKVWRLSLGAEGARRGRNPGRVGAGERAAAGDEAGGGRRWI